MSSHGAFSVWSHVIVAFGFVAMALDTRARGNKRHGTLKHARSHQVHTVDHEPHFAEHDRHFLGDNSSDRFEAKRLNGSFCHNYPYIADREGQWAPMLGPCVPEDGTGTWSNRLLVWPEKKFAFCAIEKNACTQFEQLMNAMNGYELDAWYRTSIARNDMQVDDVSKANGWRLAVFVRDPAERLLSAWRSKCQVWEDDGVNCLSRDRANKSDAAAVHQFEKMVAEDLPRYLAVQQAQGSFNAHYDPQSAFCGGLNKDEYDFVGQLSAPHEEVNAQVFEMLENIARVPKDHNVYNELDHLFPTVQVHGHHSDASAAFDVFYQNPQVLATVKVSYAEDYKLWDT